MAGANCPLRLCDQGVTGGGPHPSFRARVEVIKSVVVENRKYGMVVFVVLKRKYVSWPPGRPEERGGGKGNKIAL
jgi:hypothetical protein